ncbi:hypothetical protein EMIHUDRAFT_424687 [Emiliania huxleyi CCMP1516]|uniref:WAP domain-containing protein n=4 Tax=Emiliania huxleyi TaxID=2903 RepID=A0A0D3JCP9_EMIH1|nr:hypothetical protein EMIHUDRAFT_424687 [Emiliania huxleyi CCMP1516]EOD21284.1 hypothetical protein EMIHUDRAFT_424687 [Emiliania huxleyi CCMP1516]|eukprot:XP_005773713.1 hypothetical protein EMIHUDRAFT_424687 [Emiliania huxleyi CCMP1516]
MRGLHAVLALVTLDVAASACFTRDYAEQTWADKSNTTYTCTGKAPDECCSQIVEGGGSTRDLFITTEEVPCTSDEDCSDKGQSCCSWDGEQGLHTAGFCGEMCTSSFIPVTDCPEGCEPDPLPVVGGRRSILFASQPVSCPAGCVPTTGP